MTLNKRRRHLNLPLIEPCGPSNSHSMNSKTKAKKSQVHKSKRNKTISTETYIYN